MVRKKQPETGTNTLFEFILSIPDNAETSETGLNLSSIFTSDLSPATGDMSLMFCAAMKRIRRLGRRAKSSKDSIVPLFPFHSLCRRENAS